MIWYTKFLVVNYFIFVLSSCIYVYCRSQWPRGLRPLACCDFGFESHRGHGCMYVVCVVDRWRSLRRANHSSRGVLPTVARRCVWLRNLVDEEAIARAGLQSQRKIMYIWVLVGKTRSKETAWTGRGFGCIWPRIESTGRYVWARWLHRMSGIFLRSWGNLGSKEGRCSTNWVN
jgi:hypothetical protein